MQSPPTPVAIYVRLSQDRTGAGLGVARQEKECRDWVKGRPEFEVRRVYADNDLSASTGKPRPQYQALLEAIRSGEVEAVVAWHTDRLHRSLIELEEYIEAGAYTYTVTAGLLDLATPAGRMIARQMGAVAKYEVEQKSERQKAKNRQMAASGAMPAGGPVPFGYERDRVTVHPERGRLIRDAYRALLTGDSLGSVIRAWNASGHTAPRGGRWTYSTVRGVLLRPLNAGLVLHAGAVLPGIRGNWEPLVVMPSQVVQPGDGWTATEG
ncbi:MAG: Site-specific recombinase invertase Pin [Marmoricola sp.]|nr:Site-specific recombinase invertase Pin [Marmoricola sp.]